MAVDVLDPGDDWSFPFVPRDPDGYLDEQRVPIGLTTQGGVLVDLTPTVRAPDGSLVKLTDYVPARPR